MKKCCIEGCALLSQDVTYFEFPTSRMLRKRWLDAIRPPCVGKVAPDALLCSRHFHSRDYEDVRGKIRLKGKVVPTIFGDETQNSEVLKDPLGLPGTTDNEESQESAATDKESTSNDNHNGKVDNDNGKVDNDNGNIDNDNANVNDCGNKPKSPSRGATENGHSDTTGNDNGKTDKDNGIIDNENGKTDNDNRNSDNDNRKTDNDNGNVGNANKRVAECFPNRKIKKKWVPMRIIAKLNGHVEMSEDSTSQDSVNSDAPPPPILEDLEEHLPNYHIANMKTERQVAAMAETLDPVEPPAEHEPEEAPLEPHVPVFIELSVGQDSNTPDSEEQPNDCLMVLESVQCDIDPTLMLEARAEDEECCEQIDLDDDDDDNDVVMNTDAVPSPAKTTKMAPVDPISLLTSSDEDDVILQEPHIDTLSVSDETDEDDLPLQKLIKREKKKRTQKKKKKSKPEPIRSILVAATDFYCTHCQHLSASRAAHDQHLRSHSEPAARVYQICRDCGFTTASRSQLHRHQRKHLNEKRFKCPLCTYRSKYNMSLMYHLKTHDFDPELYNCGACGVECGSKAALLDHQASCYEMIEKFACGVCGLATKTKRAMKIHRKTVHKQRV